eukprot:8566296-Lingulodinium_polyedra.AAC.1
MASGAQKRHCVSAKRTGNLRCRRERPQSRCIRPAFLAPGTSNGPRNSSSPQTGTRLFPPETISSG